MSFRGHTVEVLLGNTRDFGFIEFSADDVSMHSCGGKWPQLFSLLPSNVITTFTLLPSYGEYALHPSEFGVQDSETAAALRRG